MADSSSARYFVLMGMQGAGKGTQAEILAETLGIPHITTGGMFRDHMARQTPLGLAIKPDYDNGRLIADDLTIKMFNERLDEPDAAKGAIIDGFPRTHAQAEALDTLLTARGSAIAMVPFFVISEAEAMVRLGGRLVCSNDETHAGGYHIKNKPPKKPGVCDICSAPLKVRKDDTPEAIKTRIEKYYKDTAPLLDYYREKGLLREIDAEQSIDRVAADLKSAVSAPSATQGA